MTESTSKSKLTPAEKKELIELKVRWGTLTRQGHRPSAEMLNRIHELNAKR